MDNHEEPKFAIFRLCTINLIFLGFLQMNYQLGFLIMLGFLVVESSLDTIRVWLAYRNCRSLRSLSVISDDEAYVLQEATKLEPTNVYEDLTRPRAIAFMVFLVQALLIGLVIDDSYHSTTRTCFDGSGASCLMFTSLGSYALYFIGSFMACVFYVGPRNSYGQKEQNPTFWLKLFLMSKESDLTFMWKDKAADQDKMIHFEQNDKHIWTRFFMSFLINGVGFHFLLHVLPIQIANQSTIIGVVFRAVGMIYLADLDDTVGNTMTLVVPEQESVPETAEGYGALGEIKFEEEKQRIINEAVEDVREKLNELARSGNIKPRQTTTRKGPQSIMQALFLSTNKRKPNSEEKALLQQGGSSV